MDILTDIFESDPFSLTALTNSIVTMPYVSVFFSQEVPWEDEPSYLDKFGLDLEQHKIYLLGTVGRSEALPDALRSDRSMTYFSIPRVGEKTEVTLDEVRGRRTTGMLSETSKEQLAAQKMGLVKSRISHTLDYARAKAWEGKVVDAISGRPLINLHAKFGTAPVYINWDWTDLSFDLVDALGVYKRQIEDKLGDSVVTITGWRMECGRNVFRVAKQLKKLVEAWKDYSAVGSKLTRFLAADKNIPGGFEVADDVTIVDASKSRQPVYNAQGVKIGNTGFIPDNEFRLIPLIAGFYKTAWGPSSRFDFEGQVLPQYVFPMLRRDHTGIDIEIDSFVMNYCERPDCIGIGRVLLPANFTNPVDVTTPLA